MKHLALFTIVLAAFALAAPVGAQYGGQDPDQLSDAQLMNCLNDELDDVFEDHDPDASYSLQDLHDSIIDALDDEGDTDAELELSLAGLEADMAEAGTSIEAVVNDALQQADMAARGAPAGTVMVSAPGILLVRGGSVRSEFAVRVTRGALFRVSRSVRR